MARGAELFERGFGSCAGRAGAVSALHSTGRVGIDFAADRGLSGECLHGAELSPVSDNPASRVVNSIAATVGYDLMGVVGDEARPGSVRQHNFQENVFTTNSRE